MAPLRVVHLLPPSSANPWLLGVLNHTDRSSCEQVVVTLASPGELHRASASRGIEAWSLYADARSAYAAAALRLARLLRAARADVVHAHLLDARLVAMLASALAPRTPWLFTQHEPLEAVDLLLRSRPLLIRAAYRALERMTIAAARAIIAPSQRTRERLLQRGARPKKVHLVPLGFDLDAIRHIDPAAIERARAEFGLSSVASAVTVGRLSPEKDHSTLLRAWRAVSSNYRGARLLVVGDGPLRGELEGAARATGLEGLVTFTGFRQDARTLMRAVDLVVHPSLAESTGMVLVEALALERPLVTTPVGIVGEHLADAEHCLVVPPGDAAAMARAIETLLADPVVGRTLARRGSRLVAQRFRVTVMTDAYVALYRRLRRL